MVVFMITVAVELDTLAGNPVSGAKLKRYELTPLTTSAVPRLAGLSCVRVLTLTLNPTRPALRKPSLFFATLL